MRQRTGMALDLLYLALAPLAMYPPEIGELIGSRDLKAKSEAIRLSLRDLRCNLRDVVPRR